jgi:hypothetical protein
MLTNTLMSKRGTTGLGRILLVRELKQYVTLEALPLLP